jgi:hypothetical protein
MQRNVWGAMCAAVIGLAAVLSMSPVLADAQQAQWVPRPAPLTGTRWLLAESSGKRVAQNGLQPYFELRAVERTEDGSAGDMAGQMNWCGDDLIGKYRVTDDRLHVRITSMALRMCLVSDGMPVEELDILFAGDPRFRILGSELDLLESNGAVRARFVAARGK